MDPAAVAKAKLRLAKVERCVKQIVEDQESYAAFHEPWADFLLALAGIYTALEQGAKVKPQSRQWFGEKKRLRREDELLRYLHQARNAEEHGIAPVSNLEPPRVELVAGDRSMVRGIEFEDNLIRIKLDSRAQPGGHIFQVDSPAIRLVTVEDSRFGDTCDPPTKHLGKTLEDNFPSTVARLGLEYACLLVADAEAMAK